MPPTRGRSRRVFLGLPGTQSQMLLSGCLWWAVNPKAYVTTTVTQCYTDELFLALVVLSFKGTNYKCHQKKKIISLQNSLDSIYYCIQSGESGLPTNTPHAATSVPMRSCCSNFKASVPSRLFILFLKTTSNSIWCCPKWTTQLQVINSEFYIVPNWINIVKYEKPVPTLELIIHATKNS